MTALTLAAYGTATIGVLASARLALAFLRDPEQGLVMTTHRAEALPQVMADRYVAFAALALFAVLYRDLAVIAALFAAFAYMAFHDAFLYARAGHSSLKHLVAGGAAILVAVLSLAAIVQTGAVV